MSDLVETLRQWHTRESMVLQPREAQHIADALAARDAEIARLKALLEEAGKWPTDGYRCRSCDTLFLAENGNTCCDRPNWDKLNDEQVADAIKALAKLGGDNG